MRKVINEKAVYLDTCVVSGLAKNDIDESESESMVAMLSADDNESLLFVTSSVVLDELNQIPKEHRTPHKAIYHLLNKVHAFPEPSIGRMGLDGGIASNPNHKVWSRIRSIMPDEMDAKHLYQAYQNGAKFFVTVDDATILRFKSKILKEFNLIACRPSELIQITSYGNKNEPTP
jgi:hypothetical protein